MPEIKLGSSKNAKNINLGSKEIEEVRLGRVLVWQNNIAPQIVLTTPDVGEYGDLNFPIGVTVASNVDIIFSAQDLDPLDTIVSYAVDGPTGFTPVPTTPITPGNPVSGLTFTIPDTLFTNAGEPTTNNVFTVTVTDQRGKDGIYTVTVIGVSVPPPTIRVTKEFGTTYALTSNGRQKASATWVITQPTETSQANYIAQYSYDNVNWSNGSTVSRDLKIYCGGSQTIKIWCRSVKTGSTTAIGNSAASTFKVTAPRANFPVNLVNCIYSSTRITGFDTHQQCDGTITYAGTTDTGTIRLDAYKSGQSSYRYTGTSFPTLGGGIHPHKQLAGSVEYKPNYIIPSSPTTFTYQCTGGEYRITPVGGPALNPLPNLSKKTYEGTINTSSPTSLVNKGPDFRYTALSFSTSVVNVTFQSGYGQVGANVAFTQVGGYELRKQIYSGNFRLANGDTHTISGTGSTFIDDGRHFKTTGIFPPAGTILETSCSSTTQNRVIADGNGGSTTTQIPNSPDCGYVAPPSIPGRIAIFTTNSSPLPIGQAFLKFTHGGDGGARSFNIGRDYNRSHCVDPNETQWNQGYYNVVYYPNQHGVITLSVNLTSTTCG
mgnify:CR=1 FL=1|tara:strand:+ start:2641 stop:4443 length:1803 start_codon:yes stop_codon:yes gene_type:complete